VANGRVTWEQPTGWGQPNPTGRVTPCATATLTRDDPLVGDVRVLVVDDQAPFRRAMALVVEETDGFVVVGQAASGEESLELGRDLQPDLVLMDVNLPGIDGLEATRRLVASERPPVVLLLSTYDEDAGEQFTAQSGAIGYVTKSAFGPDRLTAAWRSAAR
jgi:DNA-binding NarL/FixJ family response regulator